MKDQVRDIPLFDDHPNLKAFLPVLYIVWADTVLTPSEIELIRTHVDQQSWLKEDEKSALLLLLNPQDPPGPKVLKQWKKEIQKIAPNLQPNTKHDLKEIGLKLAKIHGSIGRDMEIKNAIHEVEQLLGIAANESTFHLGAQHHPTLTQTQSSEPSFEPASMSLLLDGDQGDIIEKVKKILSDPEFTYFKGSEINAYREQILKWCQHLAQQGYGAMAYPKEYGGSDDMKSYFTIMETLSYHDLSMVIKFGVQFGLWGMSVMFLGTKKHHDTYLKKIGSLEYPGCFAMTETSHGSNVKGIETTATYDHKSQTFTIHTPHPSAGKEYIGNAALHGRFATVFAKLIIDDTDYGVNAFIVELRNETGELCQGITIEDCGPKMGLNGVDNGKIFFDRVVIDKHAMLDRYASVDTDGNFQSPISSDGRRFFTMLGTLVGGRIAIPRAGLSASKVGLTIAIRYSDQRKQFGPVNGEEVSILNYRTHQRRLFPKLANAYALHFALKYLTDRFMTRTDEDMQEIEALAAGLKAWTTWYTTDTLQICRETCGGKGYLSENRIDRLKNDSDIFTTFEGDNTVLMQLVAKSRLSEFKKFFSDINLFDMMGYVSDKAKVSILELNPITIRKTDPDHLLDKEFHLSAFRYRETDVLTSAAKRLKKHLDSGMDSFDAFNQTQYHMLEVGHAYIERVILEQFQSALESHQEHDCYPILNKVYELFALTQIEKNKAWYLEHGYMEGAKTKAIRKLVNQHCWEIRPEAVALVDSFDIPDYCISAPIAVKK